MTVWIFGASGSAMMENTPDQWMQKLAQLLHTDVKSLAILGASLDFNYQKFQQIRHLIKTNDVIVLYMPGFERRWFFKDRPSDTVMLEINTTDDEEKAIENYIRYLDNPEHHELYLLNFLCNVNHITKKLMLKSIMLNPFVDLENFIEKNKSLFPNIHIAKGQMVYVTCDEYKSGLLKRLGSTRGIDILENDLRLNHMCRTNHIILANKIFNYVTNNDPVIIEGFEQDIYTEQSVTNDDFIKYELFDKKYRKNANLEKIELVDNIFYRVKNDAL